MLIQLADALSAPALIGGLVSFLVSVLIVLTKNWHGHLSIDTHVGIQKVHTHPTPRIGGVAIAAGAVCAFAYGSRGVPYFGDQGYFHGMLWPLLLASSSAFAFGLLEDVTKRVGVVARLLATMASGVIGWAITGLSITDVNVPGLDWLLGVPVLSVLFTAFAVGGVANAINIVDGFNGLATGTVLVILGGLAVIAVEVNDPDMLRLCGLFAAITLGFMLVNWPFGKLFLGDGGAYFLGFVLAWLAVQLLARHPEVSAWAPMLVCGYPLLEVGFSIYRRRRRNLSAGQPDRLHLHSLVKRRVVRALFPKASNLVRNSITGALMWLAALLPAVLASLWPTNTANLMASFVLCAFAYSAVYARITQFVWCFGAATTREIRLTTT
jgi:UDP-N-acetylmuramyl pentapeptide phosphotransferase/UDP-N-acetylglucosamine-1-phosphate transferase